jgi:hypothetical protein
VASWAPIPSAGSARERAGAAGGAMPGFGKALFGIAEMVIDDGRRAVA